ncbi:uncharacterized protein APUU_50020S [Aspergillus puulaauensis]|uniref:Uncharacterized protein n=1 Tax=Aspergillus puulaauensis TaxID=1220207 RepID=A0A7R7XQ24_9EURO|nr:uncharacterized protein APUU_50020S [Aspergillus puulaauensis]BCS25309.1 hypothetical protein APUU_50020S [Aspergillus puulaauensis]
MPLFKRMVSMSSTNFLMQPLPEHVTEVTYKTLVSRLGLASLSASERVNALVQMDSQKLLQAISPNDTLLPATGGELGLKPHINAKIQQGGSGPLDLPGQKWCEGIMVRDCQMGASTLSAMLNRDKDGIVPAFRELLTKSLGSAESAGQVMAAYAISENLNSDDRLKAILQFANGICFFLPVLNYGHCWSGHAFIYHFNEPNPWDGPWKCYASHILDIAYLFLNYNESWSVSQCTVAVQFAKDLIAFSNGRAAWPAFKWETKGFYSRVYGGRGLDASGKSTIVLAPDPRTERSEVILSLTRSIPADDLSRVWQIFISGTA